MKTRVLKLCFILIIPFYGCNDDKTISTETADCKAEMKILKTQLDTPFEFSNNISSNYKFCSAKESILIKRNYNTITGVAHYTIPIPKGSHLKFLKKDKNTIYYECDGYGKVVFGNQDLIFENETIDNLPRVAEHNMSVSVEFINFPVSDCGTSNILQEKLKKSEIQGEPIID